MKAIFLLLPLLIKIASADPAELSSGPEKPKLGTMAEWAKANAAYKDGLAAFSQSKGDEAIARFTEALAIRDGFTDARLGRARTYAEMKRHAAALEDYNRVIQEKPEAAEAYYYRAMTLWNLNRPAEAIKDLNIAIGKQPRTWQFHEKRALLYKQQKEFAKARADLDVMIAIEPLTPSTLEQRAEIHRLMGEAALAAADESWAKNLRDAGF